MIEPDPGTATPKLTKSYRSTTLWFTFDDNEGEEHAAIRNIDLIIFEFLLGTAIRQFSALYDECLGSGISKG